ncbi:MAG: hypothetical protein ACREQ1_11330, partial [Woeseiaceae bacterium]
LQVQEGATRVAIGKTAKKTFTGTEGCHPEPVGAQQPCKSNANGFFVIYYSNQRRYGFHFPVAL